jgi:hypothetical protein
MAVVAVAYRLTGALTSSIARAARQNMNTGKLGRSGLEVSARGLGRIEER